MHWYSLKRNIKDIKSRKPPQLMPTRKKHPFTFTSLNDIIYRKTTFYFFLYLIQTICHYTSVSSIIYKTDICIIENNYKNLILKLLVFWGFFVIKIFIVYH